MGKMLYLMCVLEKINNLSNRKKIYYNTYKKMKWSVTTFDCVGISGVEFEFEKRSGHSSYHQKIKTF